MAEIINLRQARKSRNRADKEKQAEQNRARFGRTKVQKQQDQRQAEREKRRHDDHKLSATPPEPDQTPEHDQDQ